MDCEIAAYVSDRLGMAPELAAELDERLSAAACASPVGPRAAGDIVSLAFASGMVGTPHAVGQFDVRSDRAAWVAIDGRLVPTPADVVSGPHLVQLGWVGDEVAYGAGVVVVGPDMLRVWHLASREFGPAVDMCDEQLQVPETYTYGGRMALDQVLRCGGDAADRSSLALALRGAASEAPRLAERFAIPPAARLVSFGVPLGVAFAGLAARDELVRKGPRQSLLRTGTLLALTSVTVQRSSLSNHGLSLDVAPVAAGWLLFGAAFALGGLPIDSDDVNSTAIPLGMALSAGVVQWIGNERAIARARL